MTASVPAYDRIGVGYSAIRRTDPVLARHIWAALGDARTVLNVGAGAGSPELLGRHAARILPIDRLRALPPHAEVDVLAVPRDCQDGFLAAFWGRPRAYLDPAVRAATSPWHDLPATVVNRALAALREDLDNGAWERRYRDLLAHTALDVGLRLITATL